MTALGLNGHTDRFDALAPWKWLLIAASCVWAFGILSVGYGQSPTGQLIARTLFAAIPIGVLALFTGPRPGLFHSLRRGDAVMIPCAAAASLAVSAVMASVASRLTVLHRNGALSGVHSAVAGVELGVGGLIQIVGEDSATVLILLATVAVLRRTLSTGGRLATVAGVVISTLAFGVAHLATYDGSIFQALFVIGLARVPLTFAYLRSRNVAVVSAAHALSNLTLTVITLM